MPHGVALGLLRDNPRAKSDPGPPSCQAGPETRRVGLCQVSCYLRRLTFPAFDVRMGEPNSPAVSLINCSFAADEERDANGYAPNRCPILLVINERSLGKLFTGPPTDPGSDQPSLSCGGATDLNVHMPNAISYVGVFWILQPDGRSVDLLAHRCPLSKAERYGDKLTCAHSHYEIWEKWRRVGVVGAVKSGIEFYEYEEWPRGRVVHDTINRHLCRRQSAQASNTKSKAHTWFGLTRVCGRGRKSQYAFVVVARHLELAARHNRYARPRLIAKRSRPRKMRTRR